MSITVKTSSGRTPKEIVLNWRRAALPTVGDALYAGQRQRTRILDRTARGVDVDGRQFAPYSTKGPYYYNPNGRLAASARAKISDRSQKAAVRRLVKKVGPQQGVSRSRTNRTIKFDNGYAGLKRWLGRSRVDLRGPRAPHMLQALIIKAGSTAVGEGGLAIAPDAYPQQVNEVRLGIYGEAAARASGHNIGNPQRGLPQRRFLGANRTDAYEMTRDVVARITARMKRR